MVRKALKPKLKRACFISSAGRLISSGSMKQATYFPCFYFPQKGYKNETGSVDENCEYIRYR